VLLGLLPQLLLGLGLPAGLRLWPGAGTGAAGQCRLHPSSAARTKHPPPPAPQKGLLQSGEDRPPDNFRYLPAFQGNAASCFAKLARFYEKDVKLMFPALYELEQGGPAEKVEEEEEPGMADPPAR
jgi:hypothetical protein